MDDLRSTLELLQVNFTEAVVVSGVEEVDEILEVMYRSPVGLVVESNGWSWGSRRTERNIKVVQDGYCLLNSLLPCRKTRGHVSEEKRTDEPGRRRNSTWKRKATVTCAKWAQIQLFVDLVAGKTLEIPIDIAHAEVVSEIGDMPLEGRCVGEDVSMVVMYLQSGRVGVFHHDVSSSLVAYSEMEGGHDAPKISLRLREYLNLWQVTFDFVAILEHRQHEFIEVDEIDKMGRVLRIVRGNITVPKEVEHRNAQPLRIDTVKDAVIASRSSIHTKCSILSRPC